MKVRTARIGQVLELRRVPADVRLASPYRMIGVRGFGRGIFEYSPTVGSDLPKLRFFELEGPRLVVSNIKGWEGAVAVTSENEAGRIASNRFLTYATRGDADLTYVAHYLLSDQGIRALGQASPGSADRNRTLSIKNFEAIEIPLPELPEQRRIAAHLDSVSRHVAELNASTTRGNLVWGLASLPRVTEMAFLSSDLPRVPLKTLVESVNETVHPGMDGRGATEFVGLEHIESHSGRRVGARRLGDETGRKFRFEGGDVTFGYLRPYLNKVWPADRVGLCSVEQFVLRPREGVDQELLAFALRTSSILDRTAEATNALQLPRVGLATLMNVALPDVRQANSALLPKLRQTRDAFVRLEDLRSRRASALHGLVPAARNEVFSAMR